jgi:hypothetical protein
MAWVGEVGAPLSIGRGGRVFVFVCVRVCCVPSLSVWGRAGRTKRRRRWREGVPANANANPPATAAPLTQHAQFPRTKNSPCRMQPAETSAARCLGAKSEPKNGRFRGSKRARAATHPQNRRPPQKHRLALSPEAPPHSPHSATSRFGLYPTRAPPNKAFQNQRSLPANAINTLQRRTSSLPATAP